MSSLIRRVRRCYSVRCPRLPASARSRLSCHPDRATRCPLASTDLPATARMQETDLPAVARIQESGPLLPPRAPLASKDQVMVTERGYSASTRYACATGERILHPCAIPPTGPLQTREVRLSRLPSVF